jgi:ER lumen protein retaining receptor
MNIFRFIGDMSHLASFFVLLFKMYSSNSVSGTPLSASSLGCFLPLTLLGHVWLCTRSGISLKTQELYCLVFIARYLDIFWNFISMYNTCMKVQHCAWNLLSFLLSRYPSVFARRLLSSASLF